MPSVENIMALPQGNKAKLMLRSRRRIVRWDETKPVPSPAQSSATWNGTDIAGADNAGFMPVLKGALKRRCIDAAMTSSKKTNQMKVEMQIQMKHTMYISVKHIKWHMKYKQHIAWFVSEDATDTSNITL